MISVVSNILPRELITLVRAALAGDYVKARAMHYKLLPVLRALFVETNPIPVKAATAMLGMCENELRLPLTPLTEENRKKLTEALKGAGLL